MSVPPPTRLGLLRHFPVEEALPSGWKTAAELMAWRRAYDASPAILGTADLGAEEWTECVCSDLARAANTARSVFRGEIEETPLLREPEFAAFRTGTLRLPVGVWRWMLRLAWMTGHGSQRICRDAFRRQVQAAADLLLARAGAVLVVSHAGMMAYLSAELRRRGYVGPKIRLPKHATLFVYTRHEAA